MVEEEESLPKSGVLTSPNYTSGRYPNNHDSTQTIRVAEGKTIRYLFTSFRTEPDNDWVLLVDGDGTDLAYYSGKENERLWSMRGTAWYNCEKEQKCTTPTVADYEWSYMSHRYYSNSNVMHVKFHTNGDIRWSGWRMEWIESEN